MNIYNFALDMEKDSESYDGGIEEDVAEEEIQDVVAYIRTFN